MKLEPIAKPVRIRIVSGEEEHSSLDSLLNNFCVEDVLTLIQDKCLVRWLVQQNLLELADRVDKVGEFNSIDKSVYIKVIKLFYNVSLSDDIISICKDLRTIYSYHKTSENILCSILKNSWDINPNSLVDLYKHFSDAHVEWKWHFERYASCIPEDKFYNYGLLIKENCIGNPELLEYADYLIRVSAQIGNKDAQKHMYGSINEIRPQEISSIIAAYECFIADTNKYYHTYEHWASPNAGPITKEFMDLMWKMDQSCNQHYLSFTIEYKYFGNEATLIQILSEEMDGQRMLFSNTEGKIKKKIQRKRLQFELANKLVNGGFHGSYKHQIFSEIADSMKEKFMSFCSKNAKDEYNNFTNGLNDNNEINKFLQDPKQYHVNWKETSPSSNLVSLLSSFSLVYCYNGSKSGLYGYTKSKLENIPACYKNEANYINAMAMLYSGESIGQVKQLLYDIQDDYYPAKVMREYLHKEKRLDLRICNYTSIKQHILYVVQNLNK